MATKNCIFTTSIVPVPLKEEPGVIEITAERERQKFIFQAIARECIKEDCKFFHETRKECKFDLALNKLID